MQNSEKFYIRARYILLIQCKPILWHFNTCSGYTNLLFYLMIWGISCWTVSCRSKHKDNQVRYHKFIVDKITTNLKPKSLLSDCKELKLNVQWKTFAHNATVCNELHLIITVTWHTVKSWLWAGSYTVSRAVQLVRPFCRH